MLVSTKGRYALRIMIDLAEHQNAGYIPLKEVAQRQGISEKYLESIIKLLVKANLLNGVRGKGGGYRLTRTPDNYTVGSVLRLTEDSLVVRVPYPVHVAGAGQDHQRLSGQHHHRRSDPNRLPGRFLRHLTTRTKNKVRKQNIRLRTLFFSASAELFCPWTGHRGSCS